MGQHLGSPGTFSVEVGQLWSAEHWRVADDEMLEVTQEAQALANSGTDLLQVPTIVEA